MSEAGGERTERGTHGLLLHVAIPPQPDRLRALRLLEPAQVQLEILVIEVNGRDRCKRNEPGSRSFSDNVGTHPHLSAQTPSRR